MQLCDVLGHERIKTALANSVREQRVGHAYIFEGARGTGRMTTAAAFAQLLVCENPSDGKSCGVCRGCVMAESGSHPDIRVITNQLYDSSKKSEDVLVDTVRSMKSEIYIKPYTAPRKIYIVPRADTMNVYAQNSLLKVLEEPPEYCTIILIAENSNMFLPTILSRAVVLNFEPLERGLVKKYLIEHYADMSDADAEVKAGMSGGSIGNALTLAADSEADGLRRETLHSVMLIAKGDYAGLYGAVLFMKKNKKTVDFILNVMKSVFRDLIYISAKQYEKTVNADARRQLDVLADKITAECAVSLLEIVFRYEDYLDKNISHALTVQCMTTELWEAIHDRDYRSKI